MLKIRNRKGICFILEDIAERKRKAFEFTEGINT
jgi:hypothetical protein